MFKKTKKGIKICRIEDDGKIVSAFNDGKIVVYKKKKWIERPKKCGPLAVFDSIESAETFLDTVGFIKRILFYCKYKPSKENILYSPYWHWSKERKIKQKKRLPIGTKLANKVKILKEIE